MKVIYSGECQKLSSGTIKYEIGEEHNQKYIKIAENPGGGRCSNEWVSLKKVEELLEKAGPEFSSTVFREVFVSKSTNNAGFLAAILKAEKVIGPVGKKLAFLSFERLCKKKRTQKTGGVPEQESQGVSS